MYDFINARSLLKRCGFAICLLVGINASSLLILLFGLGVGAKADSVGVAIESPTSNSSFKSGPLYLRVKQLAVVDKCAIAQDPSLSGEIVVQVQRYWGDQKIWKNFWAYEGVLFAGSGKDLWSEKGWDSSGVQNVPFSVPGKFRVRAKSQAPNCQVNTEWVVFRTVLTDLRAKAESVDTITAKPGPKPDLVVDKFWLSAAESGDSQIWYFNWRIRNIGSRKTVASQVLITCTKVTEIPCPALSNPYSIPPLSQNQGNETDGSLLLSAYVVSVPWPKGEFAAGNVPVRFKFSATADSAGAIEELVEFNNVMVSEFDSLQSAVVHNQAQRATEIPTGTRFAEQVDQIIESKLGQSSSATVDAARPKPDLSPAARRLPPVSAKNSSDQSGQSGADSPGLSGQGPNLSLAARRLPPLSAAKTETPDANAPKGAFGAARLRQRPGELPAITITTPQVGQVVQGDLILRITGGDSTADRAVSFQQRQATSWQARRLRGFERMRSGSTTLIVPRNQFGDGGRWRVCVHALGTPCRANQWNEFRFSERANLRPKNRPALDDRIRAAEPTAVGRPQEGSPPRPRNSEATQAPTAKRQPRGPSPSRVESPDAVNNPTGVEIPTAIIPRKR